MPIFTDGFKAPQDSGNTGMVVVVGRSVETVHLHRLTACPKYANTVLSVTSVTTWEEVLF